VAIVNVELDVNWRNGDVGSVAMADFLITNPTEYRFKDSGIKCGHVPPSGTVIDSNARTISKVVEPR
jgi:hypothetical protein